ncbi:uncharacterized protein LOC117643916 isoform X2 [Thrips palmi]|uniref:Uncharacterized protein LOC117643916 isoform X2 n=1 Tax=Thrips palmi TaxID=161013 RepID=A0A6P8ZLK1_THRPL|nr:uncharacterized protein LOC117643916 isoform X2 [Thrips palmi]
MAAAKPVQITVPKNISIVRGIMTPPKSAPSSDRKRKFKTLVSPVGAKAGGFSLFSPPSSPSKILKSPTSSSPSRKKPNLTIQQGANQNNKIFRYLQPKRLLPAFDSQSEPVPVICNNNNNIEDKENASLELKVSLVRLDDNVLAKEHNYCIAHRSPKKFCCNAASEYVTQALEKIVINDTLDPCKRLGIAVPPCVLTQSCCHDKLQAADSSSSHLDNLLFTMIDADLEVAMIRACYRHLSAKVYPSPTVIHSVFKIMKEIPTKEVVCLGKSYLKRVLHLFPPCSPHLRKHYLSVLHSGDTKLAHQSWSARSTDFFQEGLNEVESLVESLLNPEQLKQKNNIPGIRRIVKPRRYRDSPSPVKRSTRRQSSMQDDEASSNSSSDDTERIKREMQNYSSVIVKKKQARIELLNSMSNEEKIDHVFSRFEILLDILEMDLILWLSRNADHTKISDREICPLVILALWRPESDTGFDSINCRRIFSMYASSWVVKLRPDHLKTLARLIGLIAEVTSASEPNSSNAHPYTGDCCANLSRKLSDALKNSDLSEVRDKAVKMLKPNWLQMQVSANLLGISPSLTSVSKVSCKTHGTYSNLELRLEERLYVIHDGRHLYVTMRTDNILN